MIGRSPPIPKVDEHSAGRGGGAPVRKGLRNAGFPNFKGARHGDHPVNRGIRGTDVLR